MTKINKIGIGILVLSIFVSTAIAGTPGLIEPNVTKDMNKETPVWKLDQNADVRVIITLKDIIVDEKNSRIKK